eukprot:5036230-Alexandrium_andersonii.AAC.1
MAVQRVEPDFGRRYLQEPHGASIVNTIFDSQCGRPLEIAPASSLCRDGWSTRGISSSRRRGRRGQCGR